MNLTWSKAKRNHIYAGLGVVTVVVGSMALFIGDENRTASSNGVFTEYPSTNFKAIPAEDFTQRYRGVSSSQIKQISQSSSSPSKPQHTPSPEMSLMNRSPDVAGTPEQNLLVATHYVPSTLTPPNRPDLVVGKAVAIPMSEIIEKRQRIANGERLYQRVVIKTPEDKHPPGGLRTTQGIKVESDEKQ